MAKEKVRIFYKKEMFIRIAAKDVDMDDYALVCERDIYRAPGHSDAIILEAHFELFNWVHSGFQPTDPEIRFNRNGADHTSMSVGDIIEINGQKYLCAPAGWEKVEVA